ncbi:hypothetical protein EDEG_00581 [Edhazardia aedis USNM 41457]|uniref:Exportin-2 central domain-containing protein n=1 Tax=Edhazardia aedis (strain USNM 41457) TaxID=1003232 RepID=J9DS02_EDHAE|nr:hypothetical protein EDEG_00581 [Edhazardia aedis USNM 41457]|eukprot:EJW05355.1 hypothetical protein EDEG_00581 [Edhazardia aedis USNM 41457]
MHTKSRKKVLHPFNHKMNNLLQDCLDATKYNHASTQILQILCSPTGHNEFFQNLQQNNVLAYFFLKNNIKKVVESDARQHLIYRLKEYTDLLFSNLSDPNFNALCYCFEVLSSSFLLSCEFFQYLSECLISNLAVSKCRFDLENGKHVFVEGDVDKRLFLGESVKQTEDKLCAEYFNLINMNNGKNIVNENFNNNMIFNASNSDNMNIKHRNNLHTLKLHIGVSKNMLNCLKLLKHCFLKYSQMTKSNILYTEINQNVELFGNLILKTLYFLSRDQLLNEIKSKADTSESENNLEAVLILVEILYFLVYQDIPTFFEENAEFLNKIFVKLLQINLLEGTSFRNIDNMSCMDTSENSSISCFGNLSSMSSINSPNTSNISSIDNLNTSNIINKNDICNINKNDVIDIEIPSICSILWIYNITKKNIAYINKITEETSKITHLFITKYTECISVNEIYDTVLALLHVKHQENISNTEISILHTIIKRKNKALLQKNISALVSTLFKLCRIDFDTSDALFYSKTIDFLKDPCRGVIAEMILVIDNLFGTIDYVKCILETNNISYRCSHKGITYIFDSNISSNNGNSNINQINISNSNNLNTLYTNNLNLNISINTDKSECSFLTIPLNINTLEKTEHFIFFCTVLSEKLGKYVFESISKHDFYNDQILSFGIVNFLLVKEFFLPEICKKLIDCLCEEKKFAFYKILQYFNVVFDKFYKLIDQLINETTYSFIKNGINNINSSNSDSNSDEFYIEKNHLQYIKNGFDIIDTQTIANVPSTQTTDELPAGLHLKNTDLTKNIDYLQKIQYHCKKYSTAWKHRHKQKTIYFYI